MSEQKRNKSVPSRIDPEFPSSPVGVLLLNHRESAWSFSKHKNTPRCAGFMTSLQFVVKLRVLHGLEELYKNYYSGLGSVDIPL
jgi:hypothetical protein